MIKNVVIHRGPIPGTNHGHHWLTAANGQRFGIESDPHQGGGETWSYVIVDEDGSEVDDSMQRFREIREWARAATWEPSR